MKLVILLTILSDPAAAADPSSGPGESSDSEVDVTWNVLSANLNLRAFSVVFAAPFIKQEAAKKSFRLKRQAGYWDPHHSQNILGLTIQEQANEQWTALRAGAQYYMDMGNLMFDPSVADENNRQIMEMLRNAQAHLDSQTGRQG